MKTIQQSLINKSQILPEKEGKAVHLSYEDKLKLVAFTQQVNHGKCTAENAPSLGVLDVIGKDRRLAWQNLGDISKEQAMEGFVVLLDKLCPLFRTVVEAKKRDKEEQLRLKQEDEIRRYEEKKKLQEEEDALKQQEEERLKQENHRRQIQEALNQQTYHQFKAYAEQQYPGNPEQQGILVRQLQEQHYHQYMQQLHSNQSLSITDGPEPVKKDSACQTRERAEDDDDDDEDPQDWPPIAGPEMWTRKGVEEFKETIRKEAGDAVIKIGHGETVTVRVPTHEDGSCLFWEFATDGYDIGFGVFFEWVKPSSNQVSVHISESEDEEDYDDDMEPKEDLESGDTNNDDTSDFKPAMTPVSMIVPVSVFILFIEVFARVSSDFFLSETSLVFMKRMFICYIIW